MTVGTRVFWLLVAALLTASIYFGSDVEERRARGEAARDAKAARAADAPGSGPAP